MTMFVNCTPCVRAAYCKGVATQRVVAWSDLKHGTFPGAHPPADADADAVYKGATLWTRL